MLRTSARGLLLVLALLTMQFLSAAPAQAAHDPCEDRADLVTMFNVQARFVSTPTFWLNPWSYPPNIPQMDAALVSGAGGWNEMRTDCPNRPGGSWTRFAGVGYQNRTPNSPDGYNVVGWVNMTNPPTNDTCRAFEMEHPGTLALTCPYQNGRDIWEYGLSFNSAPGTAWTTDQNAPGYYIQGVSTHEFGHVAGLGHVPNWWRLDVNGCDYNFYWEASLTMWGCSWPYNGLQGNDAFGGWWDGLAFRQGGRWGGAYTLGMGDMRGLLAARP